MDGSAAYVAVYDAKVGNLGIWDKGGAGVAEDVDSVSSAWGDTGGYKDVW